MVTRQRIPWFLTDQGRKFSFAVVTGTGIAFTAARFVPNTFLLDKYKEFVHYYSEGKPVDMPKELQNRFETCLNILNVSQVHRNLMKPFQVYGFDLFHAGTTSSKFGVLVGIPVNFTYKSIEDIDKEKVQVNMKKVNVNTEVGKKLGEALILSDKEQEFGLCREILMTQNNKVLYESAYPFACIFFVYNLSQYLNKRLNFYTAHPVLRGTLYSILGLFGLGSYFLMKDMTETKYETLVDKQLCELGDEYIESGVTFYEKLLQRNQALRELMGKEGAKKYTKYGNENYGLRQPHIALVHRKQFFEQRLKKTTNIDDNHSEDLSK